MTCAEKDGSPLLVLYIPRQKVLLSVRWEAMMVTIHSGHLPRSETQAEMKLSVRRGSMHNADGTAQVPERGQPDNNTPQIHKRHPIAPVAPIEATKPLDKPC